MIDKRVAVIGAGVSGLTCGVVLAEHGYRTTIVAEEMGADTTSAAAGAIWFPYDVEPFQKAIEWALTSYKIFEDLVEQIEAGVSMIELQMFCRTGTIEIPEWAKQFGACLLNCALGGSDTPPQSPFGPVAGTFSSGYVMRVPLADTTIYLDYLKNRFVGAGGEVRPDVRVERLAQLPSAFPLVVNCAGIGAGSLVPDSELEPHRGQVVLVPKLDLHCAVVCDDTPLMYAIPRSNDCLFGGTNELSHDRQPDAATTEAILNECSRVLNIARPKILTERVGLRPFRRSGVRLETESLGENRIVVHNYGHGGSGFTLSWGCAQEVLRLVGQAGS